MEKLEAKRKQEEEEQGEELEEIRERKREERKMEEELARIQRGHKLEAARRARDLNVHADGQHSKPAAHNSTEADMPESKSEAKVGKDTDTSAEKQHEQDTFSMPVDKDYFAFLSHKKNNSKLDNSTENLARSAS